MNYREVFIKMWEASGPPEDSSHFIKMQDVEFLDEILDHEDGEKMMEAILKKVGIEIRIFIASIIGSDKIPNNDTEVIEVESQEDLIRMMRNANAGRHPNDDGFKKATEEDVENKINELFKKGVNNG